MPLQIPSLDNRRYQELLDEALARIPVHNPEWTNFNKSDPGVTLIELFAFMTENLLYRANQIPDRNRRKFLSLLGIPLQPASSARGMVTIANERGPLAVVTLNGGMEVRAGQTPFRSELGLDVLPLEAQVYFKRELPDSTAKPKLTAYYRQLYASHLNHANNEPPAEPVLYETVPLAAQGNQGVNLTETIDHSLWIALLLREGDKPYDEAMRNEVRDLIANKTLNLGIVPLLSDAERQVAPGREVTNPATPLLYYELPQGGELPEAASLRVPVYTPIDGHSDVDPLAEPAVVQLTLPGADGLQLWSNLDPLEPGVGDLPPTLEDTNLEERVVTWLRIRSPASLQTKLLWVGINAVMVSQRGHVSGESLPGGSGEPDQVIVLARTPVIPGSVRLTTTLNGQTDNWTEIADLTDAGPEIPTPDLRQPPGAPPQYNPCVNVFMLNPESGEVRFGDGLRGRRPPFGSVMRADYDYGEGPAGNVGAGSINNSPSLPAGFKVSNPVRTWGGAQAESVANGEKQIARYLQHRDRLVNAADFETITYRTPGVDIARVDVLPASNPDLYPNAPGDAPGAVTVMVIPRSDPEQPDAPRPNGLFLDAICDYLDQRRLVTTELFLRGPTYRPIWVSVGIDVDAGLSIAQVREAVKQDLLRFLSPLPPPDSTLLSDCDDWQQRNKQKGWPLRKAVVAMELLAVASRTVGVSYVNGVSLAEATGGAQPQIRMQGLDLPRVMRLDVVVGNPTPVDQLRGQAVTPAPVRFVPVPVPPENC
jgi:hypothetical protein